MLKPLILNKFNGIYFAKGHITIKKYLSQEYFINHFDGCLSAIFLIQSLEDLTIRTSAKHLNEIVIVDFYT